MKSSWPPASLPRWARVGCLFLFALFSFIVVCKGVLPAWQTPRGDFANYYTAARLLAENRPLQNAYRDFAWFQKQIDRCGIARQLGGFIPHPPPTAMVMLPLAVFEPLAAKRLWIAFNLLCAAGCIVLLSRIAQLPWLPVAVVFLSTGFGLINNFLFGQMYLLLLLTLLAGIYLQQRGHAVAAGVALGGMIPVKYVGLFFVIYYAWKKQWRLAAAAMITSAAVLVLTWVVAGGEIFAVFLKEVLPRHLQGEIQDPFAIQFQSWNSLLRRLFIADPSLNPQPPLPSPFLFVSLKNAIPWAWLAVFVWIYGNAKFREERQQHLFELALVPLGILLISPGSATYHFLLLSLSTVCLAKIFITANQRGHAVLAAVLFLIINLPHYLLLKKHAAGWLTPVGYMRLWLLAGFFAFVCVFAFRLLARRPGMRSLTKVLLPGLALAAVFTALNLRALHTREKDEAQWLPVREKEFDRHLGLLVKTPDCGRQRFVFSYGELLDEDYAIYSMTAAGEIEGQWTPDTSQKFYQPDLAVDDESLLMESINRGRPEIWYQRARGQRPQFLLEGEKPSWHADGRRFAFVNAGRIGLSAIDSALLSAPAWLPGIAGCYDLAFSPADDRLLFCAESAPGRFILAAANAAPGTTQILLESAEPLERPAWSPQADRIAFSWNRGGNRDLWLMDLPSRKLQRLTRDPAIDTAPVWDAKNRRLLFTSDRGRGLECSTMFWIPAPENE